MFLSMNWIQDFVDLSGLDKIELIRKFSLSTAEVENDILRKGSEISGIVVGELRRVKIIPIQRNFISSKLMQAKMNLLMLSAVLRM